MTYTIQNSLKNQLGEIRKNGLYKEERILAGSQRAKIKISGGKTVLNMCSNNYLGLSDHPEIIKAAAEGLKKWGFGMSSVRFICGTQEIHKQLETQVAAFLGTDDTILYSSCFDANGGLFETLLTDQDAVISDALNHASIIDGIRLCKAERYRYKNNNMDDLESQLKKASDHPIRLIVTDGVFSMDGVTANLKEICSLAEKYHALVMVDDSHGVGVMGNTGRGTHEFCDVIGRIDIITGTFGKALGGAGGGYTSGRKEIIEILRQRSRPYLFSNSMAPNVVCAALKALEMLIKDSSLQTKLQTNIRFFKTAMIDAGFSINPDTHAIIPIMVGDAEQSQKMAEALLKKGVYAIGFFYPVVPEGKARIRTQISAAHSQADLEFACKCFSEVR